MSISFESIIQNKKRISKVLILGPYRPIDSKTDEKPSICERRLQRLKQFLQQKGFLNTFLVSDFPDESEVPRKAIMVHFLKKSMHYIEHWADILIFVFLKDCDNSGVETELSFMVFKVTHKCICSAVIRPNDIILSSLQWGQIELFRIRDLSYDEENEIEDLVFSSCFNILYSLD